ncbi:MAG: hypothetical protein HC910_02870 [Spirulinaceae cyanobacterium SM2_1_0]|nr:hypothetical protein [Spirulinaceae cyanobacterium SM2_1_0]
MPSGHPAGFVYQDDAPGLLLIAWAIAPGPTVPELRHFVLTPASVGASRHEVAGI